MPNKIKISPAQAILKIIAHYKNLTGAESNYLNTLYRLYLDGCVNPDSHHHLNNFLHHHKDTVLKLFDIEFTPQVIDSDPTKRYFETHLAFESIKKATKQIPLDRLQYFSDELSKMLSQLDPDNYLTSEKVCKGEIPNQNDELHKEYADYFKRIAEHKLYTQGQGFSDQDREKIKSIITCSFLSVQCAKSSRVNPILPLNIYGDNTVAHGFFAKERGKIIKNKGDYGVSQHYGMIKAHMPLSRDDIAFSERPFNFLKSSEQAKYDEKALWVKNNFHQAVHPFSNSISGTMLCLLRALCFFQDAKIYPFTESPDAFNNFIKLFSSVVVYFSGGHSLHELISVLRLPEVINELQDKPSLKGFDLNGVFISSIFLNNNEQAFEQALQKAIVYNNHCILKNFLNIEVRTGKLLKQVGNLNIHDNRGDKATDTSLYNCSVVSKKRIRPNDEQISEQSESKKPKIAFSPK